MLQLRIHGATSSLLAVGRGLDDGDAVRGIAIVEAVAPGQAVLTAEVRPEAADRVLAAVANRGVPGEDVTLVRLDDVGPIRPGHAAVGSSGPMCWARRRGTPGRSPATWCSW
jgi:hypothetical protein